MSQVKQQEKESSDLRLSELYAWQKALKVPVTELLVEPADETSSTLLAKKQLIRAMKTTMQLLEEGEGTPVGILAKNLLQQLLTMMPELANYTPRTPRGTPRQKDRIPRILAQQIPADVFRHDDHHDGTH